MYIKSKNTLLFAITLSGIAGNIGAQPFVADSEYFASRALGIINAEAAYSLGYTGRGVTVGVLDSGIEFRHPEFADRIAFTFDIPRGGVSLDGDYDLHGTGVSGLIAAARNGRGLQGVAFGSTVAVFGSDLFSGNIEGTIVDVAELAVDQFAVVTSVAASRGVRILNNSWGFDDTPVVPAVRRFDSPNIDEETGLPVFAAGDLVTGPETEEEQELATFYTSNLANSAANFINQPGGGIIVFSASNDSMTQSAIEGGLPYFEDYTALLKGSFINVVAVGPDGETLTAYSNEAGLARSWTLAAPGGGDDEGNDGLISVGLLDDDGRPTAQIASGTSFAAPLVSGAAALVWEAFPWMTARQVTQTLLTSAVDLGAPGIDDVFGWGRLDVGAAVLGPAYFGPGEILHGVPDFAPTFIAAIPAGRSAVFGNDISGPGGLAKNGLGILELTGDNTFTGDTLVEAGALVVNGTLSSSVWIQAAGLLGGSGEIGGQVTSSGLVSPGNSIGTLTIAGDFTATADSTLVIEIAADGTSDRLVVGGQAKGPASPCFPYRLRRTTPEACATRRCSPPALWPVLVLAPCPYPGIRKSTRSS
jgi:subtilase-type serine protease